MAMLAPARDGRRRGASTVVRGIPFPWKGLNLRDRLEETKLEYATILDNFIVENGEGTLRNGYSNHVTGLSAAHDVESLMVYSGDGTNKMFAAHDTAIYDVTVAGAVGAAAISGLTNARWIDTMFGTTSAQYMVIANGFDPVQEFNGSAWSVPAITNVSSSVLSYVTQHKGRLWFVEKDTLSLWYLPANAIAGAAVEFPIYSICARGGTIIAISSWSVDAGDGQDDLFVIVTSNGEVLIYQGTDPASNYALVGIFRTDRPISARCLVKDGGDLIIFTYSGPVACSQLISAKDSTDNPLAELVRPAFVEASALYSSNFGWHAFKYATRGWLMFNVPDTTSDEVSKQWTFNDGAWFRLRYMPARCWAELNGNLYFGGAGTVYHADDSSADGDGTDPIIGEVQWAWSRFGTALKKRFTMCRPHIIADVLPAPYVEMRVDYQYGAPVNAPTITEGEAATWDVSAWDETAWAGSFATYSQWIGLFGIGTVGALRLQIRKTVSSIFKLQSAEIVFETGAVI
jgi:hypothetical protein